MEQSANTQILRINDRNYQINSFTGKVAPEPIKTNSTQVFGGSAGGASYQGTGGTTPVQISSITTIHDQFFLIGKDGRERAFQLDNFNVAIREGNIVTIMSGMKEGESEATYFVVYNHSTGQSYFHKAGVEHIVSDANMGCIVTLAALGGFILVINALILIGYFALSLMGATSRGINWFVVALLILPFFLIRQWLNSRSKKIKDFKAAIKFTEVPLW